MTLVRHRLFWKIYLTLLASLIVTTIFMGALFWFLGEAQREATAPARAVVGSGPGDVSMFAADGTPIGARGRAIALSDYAANRHHGPGRVHRIDLPDGRFVLTRYEPPPRSRALGILTIMLVVACGVGLAAYPVTMLLTRRLEALRAGVSRWGDDAKPVQLDDRGSDEVALLARTFNSAASRLDAMLSAQKTLLANASHELRSPLARLRVAVEMGAPGDRSRAEIVRNLAEMDQLVEELLLSSRLDHPGAHRDRRESIDLLGLIAEEASRYYAVVDGEPVEIVGDAVLLRRMVRNLMENGVKHGRPPVTIAVSSREGRAEVIVSDRGDGIAVKDRDRIFEPFYRPFGSGEASGGWGLGLALVRQIARRHGGDVACRETSSGGTCFVVTLTSA